jgi:hypothetical protein
MMHGLTFSVGDRNLHLVLSKTISMVTLNIIFSVVPCWMTAALPTRNQRTDCFTPGPWPGLCRNESYHWGDV